MQDSANNYIEEKGYCVIFEAEKSVLKRSSLLDNTGLAIHGHSVSDKQAEIVLTLDIDEVVIAMDEDVRIEEVRYMANKFYGKKKVSYIRDTTGLLGKKDSSADIRNKDYLYLFENRILFDEKEYELYLESMKKK